MTQGASSADLSEGLARTRTTHSLTNGFSRLGLLSHPTPIEPLPRLSARLGGPDIFVKRDDQVGPAFGGNKCRKLDYVVAEALEGGADTLVTIGALQSNHVRQTAAIAARLGLQCVAILITGPSLEVPSYYANGNLLLDRLLGADIRIVPIEDMRTVFPLSGRLAEACRSIVSELEDQGRKPVLIPVGGATPLGVLGYVDAAEEIGSFMADSGILFDAVVHRAGSGGTQAGLILGFERMGRTVSVIGIGGGSDKDASDELVFELLAEASLVLKASTPPRSSIDILRDDIRGEETINAIRLAAETEALILDPHYTGVALAGLMRLISAGRFRESDKILFIHTGGTPGLFGHCELF